MSKLLYTLAALTLFVITATAQPVCDFSSTASVPLLNWYDESSTLYSPWTTGSQPWEIINTSTIGSPSGSPYVLHTNGKPGKSPVWLTSQPLTGFNWSYNQLQWSFWFGRRANNGQNGGNSDGNIVWLYTNSRTGLDNPGTPGFQGIKVMWHHNSNVDNIRLSEVYNGVEHVLGDFVLLANLSNYEWGTTVLVKRIPGGVPTGSTVRYELWLSTPVASTPNLSTYNRGADADPVAASIYKRIDTTLTSPWTPTSTTGYLGVHSFYASARKDAHEYNQICFTDFGPTPVELTSFTAEYRNDMVNLNWHTETETNNYGFEILRSIEHNGQWETIGFVDGNGTTSKPNEYSFTDVPNADGASMVAYRLKQIDRDGSYEFSNTILVSIAPKSTDVLYNFPNPFNPTTNITFTLLQDDVVTLNVFNTAGEKVAELYDAAPMSAGYHTASFNGTELPSGRYFYRLTTSAGTKTNSMVLSK